MSAEADLAGERPRRSPAAAALGLACAAMLAAWFAGVPAAAPLAAAKAFALVHPGVAAAGFLIAYVALAALAVPAALFMGLAAGALFGPWLGVPIAVASGAAGATVAMLLARHVFAGWVARTWPGLPRRLEAAAGARGAAALFAARLTPVLPFPLVNFAAGLTPMPARTFAAVTAAGMAPLAAIAVWAGAELGAAARPADILTVRTAVLLGAFAAASLAAPAALRARRRRRPRVGAIPG